MSFTGRAENLLACCRRPPLQFLAVLKHPCSERRGRAKPGQHGIDLPRTAAAQGAAGTPTSNPQPGDLVIQNGGSHVGIYLGNGQMISALNPSQGTQVHAVSAMSTDYYASF